MWPVTPGLSVVFLNRHCAQHYAHAFIFMISGLLATDIVTLATTTVLLPIVHMQLFMSRAEPVSAMIHIT